VLLELLSAVGYVADTAVLADVNLEVRKGETTSKERRDHI
jgi:hypothetical protein